MSTEHALAQLRHLYGHMINGRVSDVKEAAQGLLGPALEVLEKDRASEDQKDAIIKALADALMDASEWVQNPRTRAIIEDALRLAGLLP